MSQAGTSSSKSFASAATFITRNADHHKILNATKLELYGLFKRVTVSPFPTSSRPSIFDPSGRAKWDAWEHVGKAMPGIDGVVVAEARYMEIAHELGWKDGLNSSEEATSSKEIADEDVDLDHLDNDDSIRIEQAPSGSGTRVSTLEEAVGPSFATSDIYAIALEGTRDAFVDYLNERPNLDINQRDSFGYTPLHLAADRNNLAIVQLLLEQGADTTIQDCDGLSALDLAKVAGHEEIVAVLSASC